MTSSRMSLTAWSSIRRGSSSSPTAQQCAMSSRHVIAILLQGQCSSAHADASRIPKEICLLPLTLLWMRILVPCSCTVQHFVCQHSAQHSSTLCSVKVLGQITAAAQACQNGIASRAYLLSCQRRRSMSEQRGWLCQAGLLVLELIRARSLSSHASSAVGHRGELLHNGCFIDPVYSMLYSVGGDLTEKVTAAREWKTGVAAC